ncbi:acyltransferase [Ponticoccus sp. SC2-23]|uniref:acyltransferase family protein n=1 Tax=Alexandriicola marinus TaxID=2081710 RepID=UPI000FDCDBD7|nr:acyltransferase [Alexandriicola marinus]MBM1222511.1 acyltransferase [Ponticoccus sp. SC6-9]MBM1227017.1 acyltransferase [Ponticoccus sp. SC6-15]MBM1231438.1 acyltransferase [Ponticoccus sp. SC6-38]MBM1236011.1 acyltransferase [Ponticoccus sp. SC6-45]MBM1240461.1 acyltransferase [Ponticoccus sp. SC6-49]MBM1244996.1 acyltransferase [Ponticoccus sp. SC2-64]MBM1249485.1 acyltransferase [Ponticoccus sp. SC6-42]MBM1253954.1 acyltransferase [Ponticoccus sp. SC6-33]MBM1258468.1 acyltransferase
MNELSRDAHTNRDAEHLKELTSLRFFAALVVVLFHMFFEEASMQTAWQRLISDGHLGVDLFFMLSGFILAHVYLSQWHNSRFSYRVFLINRFARIYPLHLFMIILFIVAYRTAALLGIESGRTGEVWGDLPWHLLLLHAWGLTNQHSWNFPSWSVSAEVFAYLIFPLVLFLFGSRRPATALILALCLFLVLVAVVAVNGLTLTKMMYQFGILRILPEFCIGVALYLCFLKIELPVLVARWGSVLIVLLIAAGAIAQVPEWQIVIALGGLIFLIACLSRSPDSGVLRHPALVYLGEISYATYMVHIFVIVVVDSLPIKQAFPAGLIHVVTLSVIFISSVLLHHAVELPSRRILRILLR